MSCKRLASQYPSVCCGVVRPMFSGWRYGRARLMAKRNHCSPIGKSIEALRHRIAVPPVQLELLVVV